MLCMIMLVMQHINLWCIFKKKGSEANFYFFLSVSDDNCTVRLFDITMNTIVAMSAVAMTTMIIC